MAIKEEALEADLATALHEEELKNFLNLNPQPNPAQNDIKFIKSRNKLNESDRRDEILAPDSIEACLKTCGKSYGTAAFCCNDGKCCSAFQGGGFEAVKSFRTALWELPSTETATSHIDRKGALTARKARLLHLLRSSCVRDATTGLPQRVCYQIQGREVCKFFFKGI